jgi:hypothetical protein
VPHYPNKAEEALPAEVREALLPLVRLAEALSDRIKVYDEMIEKLATEKYAHTSLLRQVKGVGLLGPEVSTFTQLARCPKEKLSLVLFWFLTQ